MYSRNSKSSKIIYMNNTYREELLEQYKDPQNFGELTDYSANNKITNPFCGDEIEVFIKIKDRIISGISFIGRGCVISIASASFITEESKNKSLDVVKSFKDEKVIELLDIEISNTRKKCALLSLSAIKDCIEKYENS